MRILGELPGAGLGLRKILYSVDAKSGSAVRRYGKI
jgi:hypothetical protein